MFRIGFSRILLLVIFLSLGKLIFAQTLTLIDASTGFPISNVLIYNKEMSSSVLTNEHGLAGLSSFEKTENLFAQHPSYELIKISIQSLTADTIISIKPKQIELGEVVVSASRHVERLKDVPRRITSISETDISYSSPQTSADILEKSDQVFVQRSQMGGGSPMIRGFSANRILLVYDNVRMNNAISRGGNLHSIISADPLFLERMEIIYGPGTVNYGSDALGGVINMQSKEIFIGQVEKKLRGSASLNYSSANKGKQAHLDVGMALKKWGWHTSVSVSDFEDQLMGSKLLSDDYKQTFVVETNDGQDQVVPNSNELLQNPTGYQQLSIMQKFKGAISSRTELEAFGMFSTSSDIPRYDRLIETDEDGMPVNAEWYYGPQKWILTGINISHSKKSALFDQFQSTVSYQNWKESRKSREFHDVYRKERNESVDVVGLDADFIKKINEKSSIQYGLSSYYNQVESKAQKINIIDNSNSTLSTRYPDGGSDLWLNGIFIGYKLRLNPNTSLNAGVRYTYQFLNSKFEDTSFYQFDFKEITLNTQAMTWSLGLTHIPFKSALIKANLTSGFRAPNVDDIAKLFDSEPNTVVVPNVNLQAETAYNAEIGVELSDSSIYRFETNVFFTYLDNAIVRDDYSINGQDSIVYDGNQKKVQALVNDDFARIYGCNFALLLAINKHIKFKFTYTITRGEDSENRPLRHVSPNFGSIHAIYQHKKLRVDIFVRHNGEFSNSQLSRSEQNKTHIYAKDENGLPYVPSFQTLNFTIHYRLNKSLHLNAGVENITDVGYRTYSSGVAAPGRNLIVGIKTDI